MLDGTRHMMQEYVPRSDSRTTSNGLLSQRLT